MNEEEIKYSSAVQQKDTKTQPHEASSRIKERQSATSRRLHRDDLNRPFHRAAWTTSAAPNQHRGHITSTTVFSAFFLFISSLTMIT
jgi:hypothetical protein